MLGTKSTGEKSFWGLKNSGRKFRDKNPCDKMSCNHKIYIIYQWLKVYSTLYIEEQYSPRKEDN